MKNWKKLPFDSLLVSDIEATCWDVNDFDTPEEHRIFQNKNREIIEFGAVKVDLLSRSIVDQFTYFIKPQKSKISSFCTGLTSITQEDVDNGITLQQLSKKLRKEHGSLNMTFCAWGAFDGNFLSEQCVKQNAIFPFPDNYINISDEYAKLFKLKRGIGLSKALRNPLMDIEFKGTKHRAIDDAYNTALLYLKMYGIFDEALEILKSKNRS